MFDVGSLLNILFTLIPTLVFVLTLVFGFVDGLRQGFRKSKISVIHTLIAGGISLILFFIFTKVTFFDESIVNVVNIFVGSLQDTLGVSSSANSLREIFMEYIPKLAQTSDPALSAAISSNAGYLLALVNFAFNVVFSYVCLIIFGILKLILYLTYLFFYSEKKYKKNVELRFKRRQTKIPYRKRALAGGILSVCVAFFTAIISFSFVGNYMYLVAGTGESSLPDYEFSQEEGNIAYSSVKSVESYGSSGIFKLLNLAKSSDGTPLYLYITAPFFSGDYVNTETGKTETLFLTKELGNYTTFARDTAALVLKYEGESIENIIEGSEEFSEEMLIKLISNKQFRGEFRSVIKNFSEHSSFIMDFVLSMADSYASNISNSPLTQQFDPMVSEIMNVLFVKGYKSQDIEYEKNYTGKDLPYIKPSYLINQKDLVVAFDMFSELVDLGVFENNLNYADIVSCIAPYANKLTLLSKSNEQRSNINGVFSRVYSLVETQMLGVEASESLVKYTINQDINWLKEINLLVDMAPDVAKIVSYVQTSIQNEKTTSQIIEGIFTDDEKVQCYDKLLNFLGDSKIASTALNTPMVEDTLESTLSGVFEGYKLPENLTYENTYDSKGKLVRHGELYSLLAAVKNIATDAGGRALINGFLEQGAEPNYISLLKGSKVAFYNTDSNDKSAINYFTDSILLRSVFSAAAISLSKGDSAIIYVSDLARELDENNVLTNMLRVEEYGLILNSLFTLLDVIPDDIDFQSSTVFDDILNYNDNLFDNYTINLLFSNSILIQGTVANLLLDLENDGGAVAEYLTIPSSLQTVEGWIRFGTQESECFNILSAAKSIFNSSKDLLNISEDIVSDIVDKLSEQTCIDAVYNSKLLSYSISDIVLTHINNASMFDSAVVSACVSSDGLFNKNELKSMIDIINFLDIDVLSGNFDALSGIEKDISKLCVKRAQGQEFEGLSLIDIAYDSTIAKDYLNDMIDTSLSTFANADHLDAIKSNEYFAKTDVQALADSLLELDFVDLSGESGKNLSDTIGEVLTTLNNPANKDSSITRLDYLYNSTIMQLIILKELDNAFATNTELLQSHPDAKTKLNGYNIDVYKKQEISSLGLLAEELNLTSFATIDLTNLPINFITNTYFDANMQSNSVLISSIVSKNVIYFGSSNIVIPNSSFAINNLEYQIFNDKEIYIILGFLNDALGDGATVGQIQSNLSTALSSFEISNISNDDLDSEILRATFSKNVFDSNSLIIPSFAFDIEDSIKIITKVELFALLDSCSILGINTLDDLTQDLTDKVDSLSLANIERTISQSSIIQATVSDKIIGNSTIIVPVRDMIGSSLSNVVYYYDGIPVIEKSEIYFLLNALSYMGITDFEKARQVTVEDLNPKKYYTNNDAIMAIADSSILRATISNSIHLGNADHVLALQSEVVYGSNIVDTSGNLIAIINYTETNHLLYDMGLYKDKYEESSSTVNPFECSLTFDVIYKISRNIDDLHEMLQSDVFRLEVSKILIDRGLILDENSEKVDGYCVDTLQELKLDSCTDTQIEEFFANYQYA